MSTDEHRRLKGLWLTQVVAIGAPIVGVAALVLGVIDAIGGEPIGYLLVALSVVMFCLGYYFVRILRIARRQPR